MSSKTQDWLKVTFDKLSLLNDRLEHLNSHLRQYYSNLFSLEDQEAQYGAIDVPLQLQNNIKKTRSRIKELEAEIKKVELSISELDKAIMIEEKKFSWQEIKSLICNFWQLRDGEPLSCAVSTLRHKFTGTYNRPMTGFGEIRGYASIAYSLARAYEAKVTKDAMLYYSDVFPMNVQLESSLILLGGDDKNKVTDEILKQFQRAGYKLPFRFVYETMKDEQTGKKTESGIKYLVCENAEGNAIKYEPIMQANRVTDDYGVVARLPNPFNPRHSKIFIFAGCHTFGTAAAAKVIAAKSILKRIEETCSYYGKTKFFVMIIHANVIGYSFFYIDRMEIFYPLDEETLEVISGGVDCDVQFYGAYPDN